MARQVIDNRLRGAAGGPGVISRTNPFAHSGSFRNTGNGLLQLARSLSQVNPRLNRLIEEKKEMREEDLSVLAAENFGELEESQRSLQGINDQILSLVKQGKAKQGEVPILQRNMMVRLGEHVGDSYERSLYQHLNDASRVLDPKPLGDVYAEVAEAHKEHAVGDFWFQRAYQESIARSQEQFEVRVRDSQIANVEKEAESTRFETFSKGLNELAVGEEVDLKLIIDTNFKGELNPDQILNRVIAYTKSFLVKLLADPERYDEAQDVLDAVSSLNLSGKGELGNTGRFQTEMLEIEAQIDELERTKDTRHQQRRTQKLNALAFSTKEHLAPIPVEQLGDGSSIAENIIETISKDKPELDALDRKVITDTVTEWIKNEIGGGDASMLAEGKRLATFGNFEEAQALLEDPTVRLTQGQRLELEAAITDEREMFRLFSDDRVSKALFDDATLTPILIAQEPDFRFLDGDSDIATIQETWQGLSATERLQLVETAQAEAVDVAKESVRELSTPEEKATRSGKLLLDTRPIFLDSLKNALTGEAAERVRQGKAQEAAKQISLAEVRSRVANRFVEQQFFRTTQRITQREKGFFRDKVKPIDDELVSKILEGDREFLFVKDVGEELVTDSFAFIKSRMGFNPEEISGGITDQGVSFNPEAVDFLSIPVFRNNRELYEAWAQYKKGGDGPLPEMALTFGFDESKIPQFFMAQVEAIKRRNKDRLYQKFRHLVDANPVRDESESVASSGETPSSEG